MLKLMLRNRCILCSAITDNFQILPQNVRYYGFLETNLDDTKLKYSMSRPNADFKRKEKKYSDPKITSENIKAVKAILEKHNICTANLKNNSQIFKESPWVVEQRIMLLQELGASTVTLNDIQKFFSKMFLPVSICKASFAIKPDFNLAKIVFSWTDDNSIFTRESLIKFDEAMPMRSYYTQCFVEYLKSELDLNEEQVKRFSERRKVPARYNSFRLLNRVLKILKDDLQFKTDFIIKNDWLLSQHPDNIETALNTVKNNFQQISHKIFLKYPKILICDLKDLEVKLSYLKQYNITPEMVGRCCQVLRLDSDEFKRRMEVLLKIPFTLVFSRHPCFLSLVKHYSKILMRIRYLESKNLKYATVYTLTTTKNYLEELTSTKKINKIYLKSFCETFFGGNADELMQQIEVHPHWTCVSLVQMYETLIYLQEIFSTEVIYKNIYAILYNKTDLDLAREILLKDPVYCKLPPKQFLALCVYKIEEKCHFSGEAVLTPEKYVESVNEDVDQDGKISESSKVH